MSATAHSTFSASASARLLACVGSYRTVLKLEEETGPARRATVFSAEGTLAHSLAEACLLAGVDAARFLGDVRSADGYTFKVDEDMAAAVQTYVDYARGLAVLGYTVLTEIRVSPAGLWPDLPPLDVELFGTSDLVAYHKDRRDLQIVDLKFGRGVPVDVPNNSQLLYYAAGALAHLADTVSIDTVTTTIVQPRASHPDGPIRSHSYTAEEVRAWARQTLYPGVRAALADDGSTRTAGKHCRFCPAAAHCDVMQANAMETARAAFLAAPAENLPASAPAHARLPQVSLSDADLGALLDKIELIGPWIEAVKQAAHDRLSAGASVPGWKLVPKRPVRRYADEEDGPDAVLEALARSGAPDEVLDALRTTGVLTPAQAEKRLGKKLFTEYVAPHVVKVSSGRTLAPEIDPRSALSRQTAREAFGLLPPRLAGQPDISHHDHDPTTKGD